MSGLDLRTRESALKGGRRGPALVPGKSAGSLIYTAAESAGELKMPPGKKLSPDDLAAIRSWIDSGAEWTQPVSSAATPGKSPELWSLRPPTHVRPPSTSNNPVDAFILAKLNERGLAPAAAADRATLIRRATFDLIGLPPTPEEVAAFARDRSPDAFRKVVNRLLASPRYGERWGRRWLDVVRYADTDGYANDFERPTAWRYRDYVIRSFNQDKPYDRFILEQLAGDELWPDSPEARIATGFLRMGPWEHTGMSVAAVTRQAYLDDVTHNTAAAFLGLTMGCARCHDHKFDPLPAHDYYGLQAVFASTEYSKDTLDFLPWENRADFERGRAQVEEQIRRTRERIAQLDEQIKRGQLDRHKVASVDLLPAGVLAQALRTKDGLSPEDLARSNAYQKRIEIYDRALKRYSPLLYGVRTAPIAPDTFLLTGGDLKSPGVKVLPALLSFDRDRRPVPDAPAGRRTAFAQWIASPRNPLTARVMVNRIWQGHFGTGIVATANNFGKMAKAPTHPELLDWLALAFIERGWSVKEMHRLMMLSDAYQRSSAPADAARQTKFDPENQLLGHFSPRRMEAEVLRDSILAVSGSLSAETGGPGTFPEINEDVANQPRTIMGQISPAYQPSPRRAERNRRTIYTFQKRSIVNPVIEAFNGPDLNESCERREASIVPTQAFALFNSRFANDEALAFAARLEKEVSSFDARIERAYHLMYSRAPRSEELALLRNYRDRAEKQQREVRLAPVEPRKTQVRSLVHELTGQRFSLEEDALPASYENNPRPSQFPPATRALADVLRVLINSNEFVYVF